MNNLIKRSSQQLPSDSWVDFYNMENLFPSALRQSNSLPSVNISENDKDYCVDVIAPGYDKNDFKVNIEDDILSISAEAKSEYSDDENENNDNENNDKKPDEKNKPDKNKHQKTESNNKRQYSRREYSYSSFTRSFRLPENIKEDSISANYKDGILKLKIPKSEREQKATKKIQIS